MGNTAITKDTESNIILNGLKYEGTPGLWELIMLSKHIYKKRYADVGKFCLNLKKHMKLLLRMKRRVKRKIKRRKKRRERQKKLKMRKQK